MLINWLLFLKTQCFSTGWVNGIYFRTTTQDSELICTNEAPLTSEERDKVSLGQQKGDISEIIRYHTKSRENLQLPPQVSLVFSKAKKFRGKQQLTRGLEFLNTFPSLSLLCTSQLSTALLRSSFKSKFPFGHYSTKNSLQQKSRGSVKSSQGDLPDFPISCLSSGLNHTATPTHSSVWFASSRGVSASPLAVSLKNNQGTISFEYFN